MMNPELKGRTPSMATLVINGKRVRSFLYRGIVGGQATGFDEGGGPPKGDPPPWFTQQARN
jgi:hypothetical protein